MDLMPVRFLKPYQLGSKLQIRVCRMWVTKSIGDDPQPTGLDCVIVDKQGDAIHVTTNARDIQYFLDHLRVSDAYEINKYRVVHNRASNKVVPHDAIIELNKKTTIVPVQKTMQEIPMQWFNLIELEQFYERIDRDVKLIGIFGCLTAVQPIEELTIQRTRIAKKKKEILTYKISGKPILGTTGSTVYFFNPDIPQLPEYTQKFEHLRSPLWMLPTSAGMYTSRTISTNSESKTIDQLLLLDPALHKNESFACQATVVGFDLGRGWWYKSCLSCHKAVKKTSGSFECNEHDLLNKLPEPWFKIDVIVEDNTNQHNFLMIGRHAEKIFCVSCHTLVMQEGYQDPFVAPPILANLVGQSKTFQISFGNQNSNFGKTDFIVHRLLEDKPLFKPAIPSIKPQTPAPTAAKIIINQVTPAPLTSSQPLDQQPRSIATARTSKRTLFPDQQNTSASKKPRTEQTTTTNTTRIAAEFHILVVPKIEPADKVPIATLKTKTQPKKNKDSVEDVRSQKK